MTIQAILSSKAKQRIDSSKLQVTEQALLDIYDVVLIDEKMTLVKKSKDPKTTNKIIVPLEKSFEFVLNAHLSTKHGKSCQMSDWLEKHNFVLSNICTPILSEVCRTINKADCTAGNVKGLESIPIKTIKEVKEDDPKPTKDTVSVTFLDMTLEPDNSFQYLLIYKDLDTKYIQLRPLTATDLVEEISMELMKIFCDFSPPKSVLVNLEMKKIFEAVLDRLNSVFPDKISLTFDTVEIDSIIERELKRWMTKKGSLSWSIGCHFVQWHLNNAKYRQTSAFDLFFGINAPENKVKMQKETKKVTRKCRKSKQIQENNGSETNKVTESGNESLQSDTGILSNTNVNEVQLVKNNDVELSKTSVEESKKPTSHDVFGEHVLQMIQPHIASTGDTNSPQIDTDATNTTNNSITVDKSLVTSIPQSPTLRKSNSNIDSANIAIMNLTTAKVNDSTTLIDSPTVTNDTESTIQIIDLTKSVQNPITLMVNPTTSLTNPTTSFTNSTTSIVNSITPLENPITTTVTPTIDLTKCDNLETLTDVKSLENNSVNNETMDVEMNEMK